MTVKTYREQLPFVHIAGLRLKMQPTRISGQYLCKTYSVEIRCIPKHKTAYLRLNCSKENDSGCKFSWRSVQLVRHRAVSRTKQLFSCPFCAGASPILYFVDRYKLRCRHCCTLPHVISAIPTSTAQLRDRLRAGSWGLVAEHLRSGGRKALAAMLAMEMAGISPPRLVPHRCKGSWWRDNPQAFWVPTVTAPLYRRSDSVLLYADGHLWVRR